MYAIPASLKDACTRGDLAHAQSLYDGLVAQYGTNKKDILSQMAVYAAEKRQYSILAFCFREGYVLNHHNVLDPVVVGACVSGSIEVFKVLIQNGMGADRYMGPLGSPLCTASIAGNVPLARFLLNEGANPNDMATFENKEALILAIVGPYSSLDMIKLLLAEGAMVKGTGALIAAAEIGNIGAVRVLLEYGEETGDLDLEEVAWWGGYNRAEWKNQAPALYKAAANGHEQIVHLLLAHGADISNGDKLRRSPWDIANANGHEQVVKKLERWLCSLYLAQETHRVMASFGI